MYIELEYIIIYSLLFQFNGHVPQNHNDLKCRRWSFTQFLLEMQQTRR